MVAILERLRKAVATKRQQALGTWREIVEAVQAGREVSEAELIQVMESAGKTIDDLEADVSRLTKRRQIADRLEKATQAAADFERIHAQIQSEGAKWEAEIDAVNAKWAAIVNPLKERRVSAERDKSALDSYVEQLVSTAWPDEAAVLADLNQERQRVGRQCGDYEQQIADAKSRLLTASEEDKPRYAEAIGEREKSLASLRSDLDDIDQRIDAVRQQMLEP